MNDDGAFDAPDDLGRLYEESFARVYGFAYRMLGRRETALDATQETFERAVANAASFRGDGKQVAWLFAIARNVCLARLRRPGPTFVGYERIIGEQSASSSVESDVEKALYLDDVKEGCLIGLLGCLPAAQRTVFVLCLLNDLSIAEVAEIVDRTPNAVRILLSRARARIRRFLCENCLYLGGTRCRCENMIEFSLDRGLIERRSGGVEVAAVRAEVRRFANEVELYRSLPDPTDHIRQAIERGGFALFRAD